MGAASFLDDGWLRRLSPCVLGAAAILVAACSALPSRQDRQRHADEVVVAKGWRSSIIATDRFDILTYGPAPEARPAPGGVLTVYIEGDGLAWVTTSQPSDDPTPREPVALQMAIAQPRGTAAYLARPCQYTMGMRASARACVQRYWTNERFAEPVVQAQSQALDELKRRHGATRLVLVGYSGGGAVAALLAARRTDVLALVTVAGNLDHRTWTTLHGVRPLDGSLNPLDEAYKLTRLAQWHLVGGQDRVVPVQVARSFVDRLGDAPRARLMVEPGFDHSCCWASQWPRLWESLTSGGHTLGSVSQP